MGVDTHRNETAPVNQQQCKSTGSIQFLLEKTSADVPVCPLISANNALDVYICGEDAFSRIVQDIKGANCSIDIICWGFDPGMMLTRSKDGTWDKTQTFGYLLDQAAQRGVKVRLLGWYSFIGNKVQHNQPGRGDLTSDDKAAISHRNDRFPSLDNPIPKTLSQQRHDYNTEWFRTHTNRVNGNIECRDRDGQSGTVGTSVKKEEAPPSFTELMLLEYFATHHQKTLLIDYASPDNGTGYVMGLNSVTDYWDSSSHRINAPRREANTNAAEIRKHGWTQKKPFRDYACRIASGNVLYRLNENFTTAWKKAGGQSAPQPHAGTRSKPKNPVRAQILRTQPEENERTIKALYHHLYTAAQNYLYIENQYFFYYEWVQLLLHYRASFVKQWRACQPKTPNPNAKNISAKGLPILHLFIVTPEPEHAEQIPRTYDCFRELGIEAALRGKKNKTMPDGHGGWVDVDDGDEIGQDIYIETGQLNGDRQMAKNTMPASRGMVVAPHASTNAVIRDARKIPHRSTDEMEYRYGLKVSVAMLYTGGAGKAYYDYRDIYIHSKLLIADDICFTLGSANLGQRSMAADSELNIAVNDPVKTADLRRRVFQNLSGATQGETLGPKETATAFRNWGDLMTSNATKRKYHKPMTGFLLPFKELRESSTRFA